MPTAQQNPSRHQVWKMFNRISPRYDRVNRLITAGMDTRWRREVARRLPARGDLRVLDLATGTGDQLIALWQTGRLTEGVGMDLAEEMLAIGRTKLADRNAPLRLEVGDAMAIPAADQSFDAVTISFGIRNVLDVPTALREILRVLKPAGRLLVLESSRPGNAVIRAGHLFYIRHVMPHLAGWASADRAAYQYLNVTMEHFPSGEAFCALMRDAGFVDCTAHPKCFGAVTIYQGDRPGSLP